MKVIFDEVKRLAADKNYEAAVGVADKVDWDRVKNISMLCQVGEVYERCRCYEDCRAIYERAYRINPKSRGIIYRLANVSVKLNDFEGAEEYLEEYREIVPYDSNVLLLTYKIRKGEGAKLPELISILEKLCQKDVYEKWMYELAVLYAGNGEEDKCAATCDQIFTMFGEGRYVKKALVLKGAFRTLNSAQDRYLRSIEPSGASDTINHEELAIKEKDEKEQEFLKLQNEMQSSFDASEDSKEKLQEMEDLRNQAIEASRVATAANLLKEKQMESNAEDENESMLDETKLPEFDLPIGQGYSSYYGKPVEEEPVLPGTEYVAATEETLDEQDVESVETKEEASDKQTHIELAFYDDANEKIDLPYFDSTQYEKSDVSDNKSENNLYLEDYVINEDLEGALAKSENVDSCIDDKKDVAESLAKIINGDMNEPKTTEEPEVNAEGGIGKIQSVINKIWVKPTAKKSYKYADSQEHDRDTIEIKTSADEYDDTGIERELASGVNSVLDVDEDRPDGKTKVMPDKNSIYKKERELSDIDYSMELDFGDVLSDDTRRKIEEFDMYDSFEQEVDGQIKLVIEEEEKKESDVPGQLNLDDYITVQDENNKESEKVVFMNLYKEQKELLNKARGLMESSDADVKDIDQVIYNLSSMLSKMNEKTDDDFIDSLNESNDLDISAFDLNLNIEDLEEEKLPVVEEILEEEETEEEQSLEELEEEQPLEETEEEESLEEPEAIDEKLPEIADAASELVEVSEESLKKMSEDKDRFMESISDVSAKEISGVDKKKAEKQLIPMSEAQIEIMDYFMNVPEIESQIADFLEGLHDEFDNLIICGETGSGRASLAMRLYKAIRINNTSLPKQTLKVDADALNKKPILKVYEKIASGIVIIEHADLLTDSALEELEVAMTKYQGKIYTIVIGKTEQLHNLLEKHEGVKGLFNYDFVIPEYNKEQYVDFAKNYAYSYGYVLDEMATLALHTELSAIKTRNKLITLQDVKQIINDAIVNNEKKSGKLLGGLFHRAKDREGNIILKEKDFIV